LHCYCVATVDLDVDPSVLEQLLNCLLDPCVDCTDDILSPVSKGLLKLLEDEEVKLSIVFNLDNLVEDDSVQLVSVYDCVSQVEFCVNVLILVHLRVLRSVLDALVLRYSADVCCWLSARGGC
jgi:hypothetical protein